MKIYVRSQKKITAGDASKKTNYAVQWRDMQTGYVHLATGTKSEMEDLNRYLKGIEDIDDQYDSDYELVQDELANYGQVSEITWRNIDRQNNYLDYRTDITYHILNDVPYDLY